MNQLNLIPNFDNPKNKEISLAKKEIFLERDTIFLSRLYLKKML